MFKELALCNKIQEFNGRLRKSMGKEFIYATPLKYNFRVDLGPHYFLVQCI
jgi:hypothetical protein